MQLFTLAYRPGLSTEMAALIVVDDLFLSIIKKTCMYLNCLTFLLHLTKLVDLFFSTVFLLTLDLLMQSFNSFYLIWQVLYVSLCIILLYLLLYIPVFLSIQ